jgi:hypothetical protein
MTSRYYTTVAFGLPYPHRLWCQHTKRLVGEFASSDELDRYVRHLGQVSAYMGQHVEVRK